MGIHLGIWNFKSFQALEGNINWGMILDGRSTGNGGNSKFSQMSYIQKVVIHSTCAFKIGLELYSGLAGWPGSPKYCSIYCCCKDFGWISHFCVIFQYFSILFNILLLQRFWLDIQVLLPPDSSATPWGALTLNGSHTLRDAREEGFQKAST